MSIELVMPSNQPILYCPLLLLPSIFPSISVFSNESVFHIRWPKYWSFSFSISPSIEYSGLISLRVDWFDLFAVQGTLESLLQHYSSKASILWSSAFFTSNSHLYSGEGNGNPLRYYCLEDPMDGRAWRAAVHGVVKSWMSRAALGITDKMEARPQLPLLSRHGPGMKDLGFVILIALSFLWLSWLERMLRCLLFLREA